MIPEAPADPDLAELAYYWQQHALTYRRQVSALRRQLDAFRVRMIPRI